jgi:hypothetical protein
MMIFKKKIYANKTSVVNFSENLIKAQLKAEPSSE